MRLRPITFPSRPLGLWLSLFSFGCLVATGCGDGKVKRYPVSGKVMVDGQPAEGAMVVFCPVTPTPEVEKYRPSGLTDAAGVFNLMTIDDGDGAPAGDYKVIVKWPAPATVDPRDGRPGAPGPDRLKGKYYNLDATPITATVAEQSNELQPFDLKSK